MAKKKKRTQRLPSTSKAGRVQRDLEVYRQMREQIAAMPPDTILHVGEQLVMTEAQLQRDVQEWSRMAREVGLEGEGAEVKDVYNVYRAMNGLTQQMTAGDFLALVEAHH